MVFKSIKSAGPLVGPAVFQVAGGRVVQQFSAFCKTGTVTGAVPGVLPGIPFQGAAHVGTARCCGSEQVRGGFNTVFE